MKCDEIRDRMPDVAAGFSEPTPEENKHLSSCSGCADQLKSMRATMALLDEWQAPEPSPYFDVRLQARLREEMARPQAGWLRWFRRPVLAAALTVLLGIGVGLFVTRNTGIHKLGQDATVTEPSTPGSAASTFSVSDFSDKATTPTFYLTTARSARI